MFRLGKHVRRHPGRIGAVIGKDEHLAWSGDHVNADHPLKEALGRGDINVPRPGDDVRAGHAFRAKGKRGDAPGTANTVNFFNIEQVRGCQKVRIDAAVGPGRRADGEPRHAGHLGGNGVHEQAGNKGSVAALAAGHIEAHSVHRQDPLAEDAAVRARHEPGAIQLRLMASADIGRGPADVFPVFHRDGSGRPRDFLGTHPNGEGEIRRVEMPRVVHEGLVAPGAHGGDDLPHGGLDVFIGCGASLQPAGGGGPVLFGLNVEHAACHGRSPRIVEVVYRNAGRMSSSAR